MSRSTKHDWLEGPSDLKEAEVEDVPVKGKSVRVVGLSAGFTSEAQVKATETKVMPDGGAVVTVNKAKLEALQLYHGLLDPKLESVEEAEQIMQRYGPAVVKVIEKIDELSALDKEAIEQAQARFPGVDGETSPETHANGSRTTTTSGGGGSTVPVRAGTGTGEDDS